MGPKRWIALVVAVLGALMVAPGAYACPRSATTCTEQSTVTDPPGDIARQATDVVPTKSTKGTELVAPATQEDAAAFDAGWASVVAGFPKLARVKNVFVQRVITCGLFAAEANAIHNLARIEDRYTIEHGDPSDVLMTMCLLMAYDLQKAAPSSAARDAGAGCGMAVVSLPVQIKRIGASTYGFRFSGTPRKTSNTPLALSCRTRSAGFQISMRPRARGRSLHQMIGNHMRVGFSNPTSKPVRIHTVFSFS